MIAGFAFAFLTLEKASRQLLLFLFVLPLILAAGVMRMLFLFGLVSAGHPNLGRWLYFDFFDVFQFFFVFSILWLIRGGIVKWWPDRPENGQA